MAKTPYRRLLVATEHTEFDSGAERIAFALAAAWRVPLAVVIPIVTNAEYEAVAPDVVMRTEADVLKGTIALRNEAAAASIGTMIQVRRGDDRMREILDEAERLRSDLLILRRRGKQGFLAQLLIGEMISAVVRAAPCDVLMAPRAARLWSRRVLAAIDGTPAGAVVARRAGHIAHAAGLPLTIITAASQSEQMNAESATNKAVEIAREVGAAVDGRMVTGPVVQTISNFAVESNADLVVVGHGTSSHLHFGSNARGIVGLATCAVLVVKTSPYPACGPARF